MDRHEMASELPAIRQEDVRDRAFQCFATSYIFEQRARLYRRRLRCLTFVGVAFPAAVGIVVLTYGQDGWIAPVVITVAGIAGVVELLLSIWAIVAKWEDQLSYALESQTANRELSERFKHFERGWPDNCDSRVQLSLLLQADADRASRDEGELISDEEKRIGMRAGLRQFRRSCVECEKVPDSMKPGKCDICGNYKTWRI